MIRVRLTMAALVALTTCAPAAAFAQTAAPLPLDPHVLTGRLPNGMRYFVRANGHPAQRAELRLVVDAGSLLEDDDQLGLAHFVEHMAFNGTTNFRKQELIDYLATVGMRFGPDLNATTGFDETVYMLQVPTDDRAILGTGLQILEDWARGLLLEPDEIDAERGVVIEEWRARRGFGMRLWEQASAVLFSGSRYTERRPIGTVESLNSFDHEALRRFYRDWYRPDLMAIVAVGDFDASEVESRIREIFADMPVAAMPRPRAKYTVPIQDGTRVVRVADPEATATIVEMHVKHRAEVDASVEGFRRKLVISLFNGMLTHRLSELAQREDPPFTSAHSGHGSLVRPLQTQMMVANVADGGVDRGLVALLEEALRVERHGFLPVELQRQKATLLRAYERAWSERERTPSAALAAAYVNHFLQGTIIPGAETEYELAQQLLPAITEADVLTVARELLGASERVVIVAGSEKEGALLPDEAWIEGVVAGVAVRSLGPWVEATSDEPLLPRLPEPGRVVAERTIPDIGVTEWTLSNGARVAFKPTDFRADEIVFRAFSPGGSSLVPEADHVTAMHAAGVVAVGGLGGLSSSDLQKRLAGRVATATPAIGVTSESITGAASPRDLETLLELIHLRFTAPRLDSVAVRAHVNRLRTQLDNLSGSPIKAISDTLNLVLSQYHARSRPTAPADLDAMDWERALQIYRERFGDAGDFTFVFVGNVSADTLRPMVERYIASLPAAGIQERPVDTGRRLQVGQVVRREVRRGIEPQSLLVIAFTGELEYSRREAHVLRSLGQLLDLRLRDVLREKLGATYAPNVAATTSRIPAGDYRVTIEFTAAPDRVDELAAVVFEEVLALQRDGVSEDDLAKVREMQRRERQSAERQNAFWLNQLVSSYEHGDDPRDLTWYQDLVEAITTADVHAAARRYLNPGSVVQVVLLPEES